MSYTSGTVVSRFFTITAPAEGIEVPNMLAYGGQVGINSGQVDQVIVKAVSGGGPNVERLEIRYDSGSSEEHRLVYQMLDEPLPMVDSDIGGSFSLLHPTETGSDLFLFIKGDQAGTFQVRVDVIMLGKLGS